MIIDIHGHLGNINFAPFWQADARQLEAYCTQSNVDKLCVSSSRAIMYDIHEGNMELDKALKETEKLLGYVVASPTFPESADELALAGKGFSADVEALYTTESNATVYQLVDDIEATPIDMFGLWEFIQQGMLSDGSGGEQ